MGSSDTSTHPGIWWSFHELFCPGGTLTNVLARTCRISFCLLFNYVTADLTLAHWAYRT